jgi:hypothetical protein
MRGKKPRTKGLLAALAAAAALLGAMLAPQAAPAQGFGLSNFDFTATAADGSEATKAGSHPFAVRNEFVLDYEEIEEVAYPNADVRDLAVEQIAGLTGDARAAAIPRCDTADFLRDEPQLKEKASGCPIAPTTPLSG